MSPDWDFNKIQNRKVLRFFEGPPPSFPSLPVLPETVATPTPALFDDRRRDIARVEGMAGGYCRIQGTFTVLGAGESFGDIFFPYQFIQHPSVSFGGELRPGQPLTRGAYPTVSVVVSRWVSTQPNPGATYYQGAQLAVVTTGPSSLNMLVHWQMEGKTLRNPIQSSTSLGGQL